VRLASGIPHALFSERAKPGWQTLRETRGKNADLYFIVIARSDGDEAIQLSLCGQDGLLRLRSQ
jgi:hypothetical protein